MLAWVEIYDLLGFGMHAFEYFTFFAFFMFQTLLYFIGIFYVRRIFCNIKVVSIILNSTSVL